MVERKIAFIVPVFNRWDLARPLLDALADSTGDLAGREILVVDDASEAETREAVAGLGAPFRPILNPENLGFAASVNHAIKGETRAETIVLLNSDLALRPGWLDPMLEALETQPDVFCVGNLHFSAKTSALDHAGVVFYQEGYPIHHRDDVDWIRTEPIREFPAVGFACVAFMRSRFLGLGGFDTRYRNGFEDIDLCLRARTRGWKSVVATRSEVGHHIAASPGRHDAEQDNAHHFLVRWQPLTAPLGHDWEERLVRERRPPLPGSEAPNRSSPISPPHRIFVDLARMLPRGGSGGIMVMVKKLIEAIHRQAPGQFRFLLVVQPGCAAETVRFAGEEDEIWALPGEGNGSPAPLPADPRIRQLTHADNKLARSLRADLLFVPTGVSDFWVPDLPLVSIAVDTLHKDLPECLPVEEVKVRDIWFDRMTSYSHSVICISEWVAGQVAKHFPTAAGRLVVARAAVATQTGSGETEIRETAPSAFLYPANAWAHKNHETLLVAYRLLRHRLGDAAWDLVLTGSDDDAMQRIRRLAATLGIADRVMIPGYLPPPEFAALLARTGALVFPSLYEGFGIPVLEAMYRGIPVIAGPNGSIPEVAGEACLFTDVRNPEALAEAMRRMQEDADLREKLARAGRERAAKFDFDAEAQTIAETFQTAIADFDRAGITWRPFGR